MSDLWQYYSFGCKASALSPFTAGITPGCWNVPVDRTETSQSTSDMSNSVPATFTFAAPMEQSARISKKEIKYLMEFYVMCVHFILAQCESLLCFAVIIFAAFYCLSPFLCCLSMCVFGAEFLTDLEWNRDRVPQLHYKVCCQIDLLHWFSLGKVQHCSRGLWMGNMEHPLSDLGWPTLTAAHRTLFLFLPFTIRVQDTSVHCTNACHGELKFTKTISITGHWIK